MKGLNELFSEMKHDLVNTFLESKMLFLGFSMATFLSIIKTYVFADFRYLSWLLIAIGCDILSKLYSLWFVEKTKPSFEVFINKVLEKTLKYAIYLVISFVVVNFEVDGKKVEFLQNFNVYIYGILIVKEAISTLKNLKMSFPKPLQDIIDNHFKTKDDENKN